MLCEWEGNFKEESQVQTVGCSYLGQRTALLYARDEAESAPCHTMPCTEKSTTYSSYSNLLIGFQTSVSNCHCDCSMWIPKNIPNQPSPKANNPKTAHLPIFIITNKPILHSSRCLSQNPWSHPLTLTVQLI